MKKILFASFFFICLKSFGQYPVKQTLGSDSTIVESKGSLKSRIINKTFPDTTSANTQRIKFYDGSQIITTTGGNKFWIRDSTQNRWIEAGSTAKAKSGTTLSGDTVILGGTTLDRYSAIGLNGYPLTLLHNGVNNANQSDSNSLRLVNNTTATTISDSLVTPAILFSARSKPVIGTQQPVNFRIFERAQTAATTGGAHLVFEANVNNGAYTSFLRVSNLGVIQDNLNLFGHYIGNAGTGTNSLRFGSGALNQANNSSVTGGNNVAIGLNAMSVNTSGFQNVGIGTNALLLNTTGADNTAIGVGALATATAADFNTAIGSFSLGANTTGHSNTAVGKNALLVNTTGIKSTSVGAGSMENTTTGGFNNALGEDALLQNTTGTDNIGIGWLGWSQNRTGNYNVGVGNSNGRNIFNGSNNVFIGAESGYLDSIGGISQNDTVVNSMALGYRSFTTASNQIWIGNGSHNDLRVEGVVQGAGTRALRYNPTTKQVTYGDTTSGGGGSTPTLQEVLTAGSTLNTNNVIDVDGNNFSISFGSALTLNSDQIFINSDQTTELSGPRLSLGATDSIEFASQKYTYPTLSDQPTRITDTTGTSVQVFNRATGDWKSIPSGIYGTGGGSSGWALTGNTVGANGNFIGTNDNFNFAIKANGKQKMLVSGTGAMILGDTYAAGPMTQLHVKYDGNQSYGAKGLRLEDIYNGGDLVLQLLSGNAYFTDAAGTATGITVASIVNPADGSSLTNQSGSWKFNSTSLGIGTTPAVQFHTTGAVRFANFGAGTATFDGSGNISSSSDRRKKENIRPFKSGLDVIRKINPQYFTWNKMSGLNMTDKNIGFIAQDILPLIPEAVGKDSKGYLSLNDRPILAANVNATKELYDMILALQKEVEELKAIIKAKK